MLIDLGSHILDDEPEWYNLQPHQDSPSHTVSWNTYLHTVKLLTFLLFQLRRDDFSEMEMILTPTDHLSPPSTTSRLSDSDTTSECDIDGIPTGRDGASISSLGSSSSPPPEVNLEFKVDRSIYQLSTMRDIFFGESGCLFLLLPPTCRENRK